MLRTISKLKRLVFITKCKCCGKVSGEDNICRECRPEMEKRRIPESKNPTDEKYEFVDKLYASYYYRHGASAAVVKAKFSNPASFLNSLLTDISIDIEKVLKENNIDIITYIPSHKSKLYKQEFDLPQEMAKRIAKKFNLYFTITGVKNRKTKKQHDLPKNERKTNLINAFDVTIDVKGKNVLVVDDVLTSGITVSTYATELKLAGAEKVIVWVYTYNTGKGN